jgi:hypothetical protein
MRAYSDVMSEIPLGEASGEVAAAEVDADAEAEAQVDTEAEAEARLDPEAEGEL